jgi:hypothetical protein
MTKIVTTIGRIIQGFAIDMILNGVREEVFSGNSPE